MFHFRLFFIYYTKKTDVLKPPSIKSHTDEDGLVWSIDDCKTIPYEILIFLKQKGLLDNVLANR